MKRFAGTIKTFNFNQLVKRPSRAREYNFWLENWVNIQIYSDSKSHERIHTE